MAISFLLFNLIISLILLFNNIFFIRVFLLPSTLTSTILNLSYYSLVYISFLLVNYFIYLICWQKQKIFKNLQFFLLLSTFIIGYYSLKYHVNMDDVFVINIINELSNAQEVISIKDLLIIGLFIIILTYTYLKINIKKIRIKPRTIIINSFVLSLIFIIAVQGFKYSYLKLFNKYRGLNQGVRQEITHNINYYKYYYTIKNVIKYYKNIPNEEDILSSVDKEDVRLNKKFNHVTTLFLMSDSVRAKSMSLFGYNLPTNPNLQKLYNKNKIYLFKESVCYVGTFVSLNCMLSLKPAYDFRELAPTEYAKEKITKYFNYLGIDTYYLYNNDVDFFTSGYKYIPYHTTTPSFDKDLLPSLYKTIGVNQQFITVNLRGAHIPYDLMLEPRFKKFDHDYTNKILQTDYIWSDIVEHLSKQSKPVFAIFVGDHGESLGEIHNGIQYFVHGAKIDIAPPEQKEVPLIIYINDAYKKLYPNYAKNIAINMQRYRTKKRGGGTISSDVISYSLLQCSGIEGKIINPSLSLCSSSLQ